MCYWYASVIDRDYSALSIRLNIIILISASFDSVNTNPENILKQRSLKYNQYTVSNLYKHCTNTPLLIYCP